MTVTNSVGETREVLTIWENAWHECPFCYSPQPDRCGNPGCSINLSKDRVLADRAKQEEEEKDRRRRLSMYASFART